jgi:hypothetical protein
VFEFCCCFHGSRAPSASSQGLLNQALVSCLGYLLSGFKTNLKTKNVQRAKNENLKLDS